MCEKSKVTKSFRLSFSAELSCSHRGSTLSLATEADSVISGGAESQRWDFPVLEIISSHHVRSFLLTYNCVFQGWICVLYGVLPHAEQSVQQELWEGLGERFYSLFHHFHGVQRWAEKHHHKALFVQKVKDFVMCFTLCFLELFLGHDFLDWTCQTVFQLPVFVLSGSSFILNARKWDWYRSSPLTKICISQKLFL